jgi:hypothetical protein
MNVLTGRESNKRLAKGRESSSRQLIDGLESATHGPVSLDQLSPAARVCLIGADNLSRAAVCLFHFFVVQRRQVDARRRPSHFSWTRKNRTETVTIFFFCWRFLWR